MKQLCVAMFMGIMTFQTPWSCKDSDWSLSIGFSWGEYIDPILPTCSVFAPKKKEVETTTTTTTWGHGVTQWEHYVKLRFGIPALDFQGSKGSPMVPPPNPLGPGWLWICFERSPAWQRIFVVVSDISSESMASIFWHSILASIPTFFLDVPWVVDLPWGQNKKSPC